MIPELGIIPSPRGSQNWGDPDHPSGVAPGKRPRLTPSPAIAIEPGKMKMPFGTPGGDVQTQAMLQVFLNIHLFGMEVQEAVEAPRVASYSYPVVVRAARLSSGPAQHGEPDRQGDRRGARPASATRSDGGRTGPGSPARSARSSPTRRAACSRAAPIRAGRPMRSGCDGAQLAIRGADMRLRQLLLAVAALDRCARADASASTGAELSEPADPH